MVQAVVLDIGGVLLRTEDRSGRQAIEIQYNLPLGGSDDLVFNSEPAAESTIGKINPEKIWDNVADVLSLTPQSLEKFKRDFWHGDQVDQELLNFLISLKPLYKTALLSNAWVDSRQVFANQYQIVEGQTVDHILISSELGLAKPDLRIYQILADTLECGFHQILFVDDFIENVEAAKSLGILTIHYQPEMNLITKIQSILDQR